MSKSPFQMPGFHPAPDDFFDLSWEMFGELCRALALKVARDYQPEAVVGIARAGVIPGAIVASILRVDFHSLKISRRDVEDQVRERPAVLSDAPRDLQGKRVLIVDEITTSGDTLRLALAAIRGIGAADVRTATSFARSRGYRPDYCSLETDSTVIFPWDQKIFDDGELVVNPMYRDVVDD